MTVGWGFAKGVVVRSKKLNGQERTMFKLCMKNDICWGLWAAIVVAALSLSVAGAVALLHKLCNAYC